MGRLYKHLTPDLNAWIERQHLFFAATAPGEGGHVNCSPKGLDTLRILDPRTVVYLDLTGSGVETIADLRHNGRIVQAHDGILTLTPRTAGGSASQCNCPPRQRVPVSI